jgi:SAM-dependent methyltransferase
VKAFDAKSYESQDMQVKTQDKKLEQEFFDNYIKRHGDHDLCVAASYDFVLQNAGLDDSAPLRILDVGNGTGLWSEMLVKRGHTVWGFDLSFAMAKAGKMRKGFGKNFFSFVSDIEHMSARTESFDTCFGAGILHHLPSLALAGPEIKRVLKTDGRFCFFEPNGSNPLMRLSYLLRTVLDHFIAASGKFSSINEETHPLTFYEKQLPGLFPEFSVKPLYIKLKHDPCYKGAMRWGMAVRNAIIHLLYWILPKRFGCNFVLIMGRK